ncbi:MAG: class I adenylate-forming enzyme family protein [Novosphingobium sp.]
MAGADASTVEWLARHAAERPEAPALILDGRRIGFGTFQAALGATVRFLAHLDLPVGAVAALDCDDPFEHWLLVLGCETLGVATASLDGRARETYAHLLRIADILISTAPGPLAGCRRIERLAPGWPDRLSPGLSVAPLRAPEPLDPQAPLRLLQTSGTTGPVKWMRATRRSQDFWLMQYRRRSGMSRTTRHLVVSGFHLNAAYLYATACLRAGGCCLIETRRDLAAAMASLRPTHAAMLPAELALLAGGGALPGAAMTVSTLGGHVGPALRGRIEALFGGPVIESYGSNESGPIATMDADGSGRLLPEVEAAILDDEGRRLPDGQAGLLRVRSAGVVAGYIDAPQATAAAFHDGWFQPGDLAVMLGGGRIRLLGRADDMLNIGGVKIAPLDFEAAARALAAVDDICVVELSDGSGRDELAVAVRPAADAVPADIARQIGALLPPSWGRATLRFVPAIPRTATGKPARAALRALLRQRPGLVPDPES